MDPKGVIASSSEAHPIEPLGSNGADVGRALRPFRYRRLRRHPVRPSGAVSVGP